MTGKLGSGRHSRFTAEQVDRMERMRALGMSHAAIGETFGTTKQYVCRLIAGNVGPRYRGDSAPKLAPQLKSAFEEYDARKLKSRGFSVMQIAALLRKPYREVEQAVRQ